MAILFHILKFEIAIKNTFEDIRPISESDFEKEFIKGWHKLPVLLDRVNIGLP